MSTEFDSLSRSELQAAAKKHGIKANGASADIIQRLKEKVVGGGTPATTAASSSSSSSKKANSTAGKKRKGKANEDEETKEAEEDESAMKDDDKSTAEEEDENEKPAKQPAKKKTKKGDAAPAAAASSSAAAAIPDLKGKNFIVMGAFECGKYKIESEISNAGGEVSKSVLKSLNYLIYGKPESNGYGGVSGPGSKKFKEAKKMKGVIAMDEAEFLAMIAKVKGGAVGGADADPVDLSQHPFAIVFRSILKSLGIPDSALRPASAASITSLEEGMEVAVPLFLRALLAITDGSNSLSQFVDDLFLFPSVDEMSDQSASSSILGDIFKAMGGWVPFQNIDAPDCWEAIDKNSGRIYSADFEGYLNLEEYVDSLGVRLQLLDEHLKAKPRKKQANGRVSCKDFVSKTIRMSESKEKLFRRTYNKAQGGY